MVRVDAAVVDYLKELTYCKNKTTLLNHDFAFTISQSTCIVMYSEPERQKIVRYCCIYRNLCVGFNSSHSGGHLLSGDRGEQLVVKATLSAISKLILGKRNYFFCVIVPPVHDNQPMVGLGIKESPNSLSSSIVRGSTLIHKG